MNSQVKETYRKIKNLEIQGATNVALESLRAIREIEDEEELEESVKKLKESRPTEPLMRNGLKYVQRKFKEGQTTEKAVETFEDIVEKAIEKITNTGSEFIEEETTVMTHCHSSLVENILKKAHGKGKLRKVIVTETRPRYQGRTTAKKMAEAGIPVTIAVDSARREMIQEADLALVGADVITSDGHTFNKIGTRELAWAVEDTGKKLAVASQLLKIDPETLKGKREKIEERPPEEVWENPPKGVEIRNPAFDATSPEHVDYTITEEGIINPIDVIDNAKERYPWIFN